MIIKAHKHSMFKYCFQEVALVCNDAQVLQR